MIEMDKTVLDGCNPKIFYYGFVEYIVCDKIPDGFEEIRGTNTAPNGTNWYFNGYGVFEVNEYSVHKRLIVLVVENLDKFKKTDFFKNSEIKELKYTSYSLKLKPKKLSMGEF